ncbi:MAG: plasmid stabilization protein [Methylococcales bacterium]|nr:plasmid stabilization protein [Methylococcales bacterium]
MTHLVLSDMSASVSELKNNPLATVAAGGGSPVAIFHDNKPEFYCVPAAMYEALLEKLDDIELNAIADERLNDGQALIRVSLDDL